MIHLTSVRFRNQSFSVLVRSQIDGKMKIESINGFDLKCVPNLLVQKAAAKLANLLDSYNNPKQPENITIQYGYDDRFDIKHPTTKKTAPDIEDEFDAKFEDYFSTHPDLKF